MELQKKTIAILLLAFSITPHAYHQGSATTAQTKKTVAQPTYKDLDQDTVDFINTFFTKYPVYSIKMKAANNDTKKALEGMLDKLAEIKEAQKNNPAEKQTVDPKDFEEYKKKLLGCVQEFFAPLHKFKVLLLPMAEVICYGNKDTFHLDELNIKDDKNYIPLLVQFFQQSDAENFFETKIADENAFLQTCYEFLTVMGVIRQSFTIDTMKKAMEFFKAERAKLLNKNK